MGKVKKDKEKYNNKQILSHLRKSVIQYLENYETTEAYCFDKDIPKSVISVFLNEEGNDYRLSTLEKIASSIDAELVIKAKQLK